jgi:hypothetical protein
MKMHNGRVHFDQHTSEELELILGPETFQVVRSGLEAAAGFARLLETPRAGHRSKDRALRQLQVQAANMLGTLNRLDPFISGRLSDMLNREFGLDDAKFRKLLIYLVILTSRAAATKGKDRSLFQKLAAMTVGRAMESAGLPLGTSVNSKFGKVLSEVLRAGDRKRTGDDVRHLQKEVVKVRKMLGGSLDIDLTTGGWSDLPPREGKQVRD